MTMPEHAVLWGRTLIPFEIRRSGREKTVSIAVEPGGEVVVTAPQATDVERLRGLVREKAGWIVRRRRLLESLDPAPTREFLSGETFLYRGRQHRLLVTTHDGPTEVKLEQGRLVVRLPGAVLEKERPAQVARALEAWFRRRAEAKLPEMVDACVLRAGLSAVPVQVVTQAKRWASCTSAGCIRLNWRLIQAPSRLVEYVVFHELTHLRLPNHDEAFWAALGALLPDYERRKDDLRRLGPRLVW